MYENLTDRQKDLLRDIVKGVRDGKVHEPFIGVYTFNGSSIIGIGKDYEISIRGDLQILDDEGLLSCSYTSRGESSYTLLQTAYKAVDLGFFGVEPKAVEKHSDIVNEAFIVCAIRDEMTSITDAIKDVTKEFGIPAFRADDYQGDFQITPLIIEKLETTKLIITDLSFERPNVYFEYGYARGVGRTGAIITLIQKDHKAHFDVKDWNQIQYFPDDLEGLKDKLRSRIRAMFPYFKPLLELLIEELPEYSESQDNHPSSWFHRILVVNNSENSVDRCMVKLLEIRDKYGNKIRKFDPITFYWSHQNQNNPFQPLSISGDGNYQILDILQEKLVHEQSDCDLLNEMQTMDPKDYPPVGIIKNFIKVLEDQISSLRIFLPEPEKFIYGKIDSPSPGDKPILLPGTYFLQIGVFAEDEFLKSEWYKLDIAVSTKSEQQEPLVSKTKLSKITDEELGAIDR